MFDMYEDPLTYYDRQGRQISGTEWSTLKLDRRNSIVGRARVTDACAPHMDVAVLTSWCGWHVGPDKDGPPLMFETIFELRFPGNKRDFNDFLRAAKMAYGTEQEAVTGHEAAVRIVSTLMAEPQVTTDTDTDTDTAE